MKMRGLAAVMVLVLGMHGRASAQAFSPVGESLQEMESAILRNLPVTTVCKITIALTRPCPEGKFVEAGHLPPLRLLWKNPSGLKLEFFEQRPPATSIPSASNLSTTATSGPYFEPLMERFFERVRRLNRLGKRLSAAPGPIPETLLDPVQMLFMTLRANANARCLGSAVLAGEPALGLDFPGVMSALPLGVMANGLKIWISQRHGLPMRIRFITRREGIFTFDLTYALYQDKTGVQYNLPSLIMMQPALAEDAPSAAYPIKIQFSDYKLNAEMADADFQ